MYKARRTDAYFRGEVDKFIQAAENHARIEKTQMIHCPCRTCKNLRVFSNTTIIRSHVLISGFVDNYMIWNKHGEEEQPQRENSIDEIIQESEFNILFDAFDDAGCEDEGVGGGHFDGVDGSPIDLGSDNDSDELDDGDFLSQLLRHTKAELLVGSAKGLENFETVKKSEEENIYERSKGCPKH